MMKQYESGRGTKQIISAAILGGSILASSFGLGMQIQKLVNSIDNVRADHVQIMRKLDELGRR
jgi:hypothetical protein